MAFLCRASSGKTCSLCCTSVFLAQGLAVCSCGVDPLGGAPRLVVAVFVGPHLISPASLWDPLLSLAAVVVSGACRPSLLGVPLRGLLSLSLWTVAVFSDDP